MTQFKQFEDIPVWQDGRKLVKKVYAATRQSAFSRDHGLCSQIQRAVISVTSNIAEGHERGTTPDLIQFLYYAKGSAGEVRSQLYNAEDLEYIEQETAEALRDLCRDIGRQLFGWITSMQTPDFKGGPKYHKEPSRKVEQFWEKTGMERMPDGSFRKKNE